MLRVPPDPGFRRFINYWQRVMHQGIPLLWSTVSLLTGVGVVTAAVAIGHLSLAWIVAVVFAGLLTIAVVGGYRLWSAEEKRAGIAERALRLRNELQPVSSGSHATAVSVTGPARVGSIEHASAAVFVDHTDHKTKMHIDELPPGAEVLGGLLEHSARTVIKIAGLSAPEQLIEGQTFDNVLFEGPALLRIGGNIKWGVSDRDAADCQAEYWEVPTGAPLNASGMPVVPVSNCAFSNCAFQGVIFAGPSASLTMVKEALCRP